MTVLPSPEAMIVICTAILIVYTAHVLDKAFDSSKQFEDMLKARDRIMGLQAENDRLRELVRDMYTVMVTDAANCDVTYPEQFEDRMRELGVEVEQ